MVTHLFRGLWNLSLLVVIIGGVYFTNQMSWVSDDIDSVLLPGGGKIERITESGVIVDVKIYSATDVLLKHSWNDHSGISHCNDYDETGDLVQYE